MVSLAGNSYYIKPEIQTPEQMCGLAPKPLEDAAVLRLLVVRDSSGDEVGGVCPLGMEEEEVELTFPWSSVPRSI